MNFTRDDWNSRRDVGSESSTEGSNNLLATTENFSSDTYIKDSRRGVETNVLIEEIKRT